MHRAILAVVSCAFAAFGALLLPFAGWPAHAAPADPVMFRATFDDTLDATGPKGVVPAASVEGKVEYRAGKMGRALLCGGDGALVKYPVAGHVRPRQGTVSLWVQAVDWPANEDAFHVFFETEGPGWLVLYKFHSGGTLMLTGADKARYSSAWWQNPQFANGEWHHLAGVWAHNHLALYVDGKLKKERDLPSLPDSLAGGFLVGDAGWVKPHATHTLIDDLTVYRYALPAEQIALAAEGKPVTYRPALPISVEPRPAQGRWRVEVDGTGHVGEDGAGTAIRVDVLAAGAPTPNRVYATARIEKFDDSLGRTTLECARIPAGACLVRATVLDAAGKEVARSEVPFTKPPDAPWAGNRIGLEERVLPPFTAIRVGGGGRVGERESGRVGDGAGSRRRSADKGDSAAAECWGRRYALGGPFPTQIESAGQGMLAAPVEVVAATDAGPVLFKKGAGKTTAWSATRARHTGSAEAVGLKLETRSTLEYDGLLWTDVTLTPKAPVTLTEVTLRIPVRAANALYLHHARGSWGEDTAGALPAAGYESAAFVPSLWVGDDDRGLAWLAETQQGWSNAAGKPLQFVARKGDVVEMRIQVVNQPTKVEGPLRFSFGLQATPVKPRPAGARGWRLGNLGDAPTLSQPSMGTIQVIWSNGLLAQYGYPWPADPEKFRKIVADLHARKNLAVPYVNLNYFSAGAPEWAYYSPDFRDPSRSFTDGDVGAMGHATIGACPHSPAWRDLIAYKIARFVEEFQVDGIYVDCWNPFPCTNEEHGCGWRDAAGNLHGNFGLRDYREIVRRVRALLAERRPNFHIIIHMSSDVVIPMLAFADSMLDGEQYQGDKTPKDDYLAVLPLDKWRAENTGIQWGVFPFFLPELAGEHRRTTVPTERLMGLMLAHDTSPWPIWCNESVIFGAWKTVDRFGIVDAEFLPYWKPNGVTTDNAEVLVSAYRKPGRALLVVLNSGKADAHVALKVDPKPLSLKPAFAAAGAADDAVLSPDGRALTLDVPARGYRLVVLK